MNRRRYDPQLQGDRLWPLRHKTWECEPPAKPPFSAKRRLGRSLALPESMHHRPIYDCPARLPQILSKRASRVTRMPQPIAAQKPQRIPITSPALTLKLLPPTLKFPVRPSPSEGERGTAITNHRRGGPPRVRPTPPASPRDSLTLHRSYRKTRQQLAICRLRH
jgi:hypothetical protein